jgi:hypothetical protein
MTANHYSFHLWTMWSSVRDCPYWGRYASLETYRCCGGIVTRPIPALDDVRFWQIVLRKSQNAVRLISRQKTKRPLLKRAGSGPTCLISNSANTPDECLPPRTRTGRTQAADSIVGWQEMRIHETTTSNFVCSFVVIHRAKVIGIRMLP